MCQRTLAYPQSTAPKRDAAKGLGAVALKVNDDARSAASKGRAAKIGGTATGDRVSSHRSRLRMPYAIEAVQASPVCGYECSESVAAASPIRSRYGVILTDQDDTVFTSASGRVMRYHADRKYRACRSQRRSVRSW